MLAVTVVHSLKHQHKTLGHVILERLLDALKIYYLIPDLSLTTLREVLYTDFLFAKTKQAVTEPSMRQKIRPLEPNHMDILVT